MILKHVLWMPCLSTSATTSRVQRAMKISKKKICTQEDYRQRCFEFDQFGRSRAARPGTLPDDAHRSPTALLAGGTELFLWLPIASQSLLFDLDVDCRNDSISFGLITPTEFDVLGLCCSMIARMIWLSLNWPVIDVPMFLHWRSSSEFLITF